MRKRCKYKGRSAPALSSPFQGGHETLTKTRDAVAAHKCHFSKEVCVSSSLLTGSDFNYNSKETLKQKPRVKQINVPNFQSQL